MRLNAITLPLAALNYLQTGGLWNITKIGWGRDNTNHKVLDDNTLQVFYPKGSYAPSKNPQGGIGIYASPFDLFPADEIMFSYEVKFDETFNPMLGGKLPGIFLSNGVGKEFMKDASGGKHNNVTASCRISWRQNFQAEAYVYVPEEQNKDYYKIANFIDNKVYGDSLWRGLFQFSQTDWNTVCIYIKVNSFDKFMNPKSDGVLHVTINGETQRFNKLVWRTNPKTQIAAIVFATFFGGGTEKYATPVDTSSYFRNVMVETH